MTFLSSDHQRGRGYWKFNNSLLYDPEYVKRVKLCIEEIVAQYKLSGDYIELKSLVFSVDDQLFFETLKLQIRGITLTTICGQRKRERSRLQKELEEKINHLQHKLDQSPLHEIQNELSFKQHELQKLREQNIKGSLIRSKANWAAKGEKNSKYFLSLEKRNYVNKLMPKLVTSDNKELTEQNDINNTMKTSTPQKERYSTVNIPRIFYNKQGQNLVR